VKIGVAIERLAEAERELADRLVAVGERHRADHDVYHLTRTLAGVERSHLDALGFHAARYGADLGADGRGIGPPKLARALAGRSAELLGRRPEPGLLLLLDLRELHVLASGTSLDWVALGQAAQAARDSELLETVSSCHPETLRTLKWTTYRVKEAAPQVLTG
jgi:hypothetical protein